MKIPGFLSRFVFEPWQEDKGMDMVEKMSLSREFFRLQEKRGQVQSCFDKAVNLSFSINGEERLLTLLKEGSMLLPDSILLPEAGFYKISQGGYVIIENHILSVGEEKLYLDEAVNRSLYLSDFAGEFCEKGFEERLCFFAEYQKENRKKSDLERLPERYRSALASLAEGYVEGSKAKAGQAFEILAGAGRGLTPSGDDAVLGILAVMCALYSVCKNADACLLKMQTFSMGKESFEEFSAGILKRLLAEKLTTRVSAKYLKCACRGQFSEALCRLSVWIVSGEKEAFEKQIDRIMQTGHTSGADMLYGMEAACRVIGRKWRTGGN